jgi:hypothetical protein
MECMVSLQKCERPAKGGPLWLPGWKPGLSLKPGFSLFPESLSLLGAVRETLVA